MRRASKGPEPERIGCTRQGTYKGLAEEAVDGSEDLAMGLLGHGCNQQARAGWHSREEKPAAGKLELWSSTMAALAKCPASLVGPFVVVVGYSASSSGGSLVHIGGVKGRGVGSMWVTT